MNFPAEEKFKAFIINDYRYLYLLIISILAIWIRLVFLNFESGDYRSFLSGWYDHLNSAPGLSGFKDNFSNYSPLYLYLLKFATLLPFSKLFSVKLLPIIFDFVIAIYASKLIGFCRNSSKNLGTFVFGVMLFIPTVLINSSMWGQVDSIPTAFVIGSIYYLVKKRPFPAFLLLGIAFSFKFQSLFILPVFVIFYLKNRITWLYFLIIPSTFIISVIPAFLGGGSLGDLLSVYFQQMGFYKQLTLNAPTIFQIFYGDFETYNRFGIVLAFSVAFLIISAAVFTSKALTCELIIKLSLFFVMAIPFVLPQMHERYFYFADVISVVAVFVIRSPKYILISAMMILISFLSYIPFLFDQRSPFIPFAWMTLGLFSVICVLVDDIFRNSESEYGNLSNEAA